MKRLLTPRRALGILVLVTVSTSSFFRSEDAGRTQSLSFATGWFDFNRQRDEAFETRLAYRVGRARRPLRGVAVATLTDDSTLFSPRRAARGTCRALSRCRRASGWSVSHRRRGP